MSERTDVQLLRPSVVAELGALPLTYPRNSSAGATAAPAGYARFTRSRTIGDAADFGPAMQALLTWQVQVRSGLRVAASAPEIEMGVVAIMRIGFGSLSLRIPCRVVDVIDEPERRGFTYGTLPGHPESGEESFVLDRLPNGSVVFTISAFSRPATRLARLGGPLTTQAQRLMTRRYLHALD